MKQHRKIQKQSGGFWLWLRQNSKYSLTLWNRLFIRREIFIRENKGTKRIIFEKSTQIQLALVAIGFLLWTAYATNNTIIGKNSTRIIQERLAETHNIYENHIANMQKEYEELYLKITLAEKEFKHLVKEINERHKHLLTLIHREQTIGQTIEKRKEIINQNKNTKEQNQLKPSRNHDDSFLSSRPVGPVYKITSPPPPRENNPRQKLIPTRSTITRLILHTGNKKIDHHSNSLINIDREQKIMADHLEEKITKQLKHYQRAFAMTEAIQANLFSERVSIVKKNNHQKETLARTQTGGPLIAINPPEEAHPRKPIPPLMTADPPPSHEGEKQSRQQINHIHKKIHQLKLLDDAISHLPLARPIAEYFMTSPFGPRIDPFTQEWAFHTGIDIAGQKGELVTSTLPGFVSFAGRAYGYGKMVEIEHGFGLKTRYGHLKKINVKKGQQIQFQQPIGMMGNTGRSTGDHLHYEILVEDKPHDPWKFIAAGEYILETID